MPVFFATDRNDTFAADEHPRGLLARDPNDPQRRFGILRQRGLTLGVARVSIPPPSVHARGRIESPGLFVPPDRRHDVMLTGYDSVWPSSDPNDAQDAFLTAIQQRFAEAHAADPDLKSDEILIYVHGFATQFDDAVQTAAQIAHDIQFRGVVICYSWTSAGRLLAYFADGGNVDWTIRYFADLLGTLRDHFPSARIHLIGHSMGTRVVARGVLMFMAFRAGALLRGILDGQVTPSADSELRKHPLGQVVLAAADMDADIFERDFVPFLLLAAERTTIYMSTQDLALAISGRIHDYSRVGVRDLPNVKLDDLRRVQVVDVTSVDKDPIGHFYISDCVPVLDDLSGVLDKKEPEERGLRREFLYRMTRAGH